MFVRSLWKIGRTLDILQILSEMDVYSDRKSDSLGLYNPEFATPTKLIFH